MPNGGSVHKPDPLLTRGTIVSGAVSVSLDDSWTGRTLLEALGRLPLRALDIMCNGKLKDIIAPVH
uniref:Uncharacterized protein n=1 Tax=Anopheles dirus TaxID=7168 RepID=A0A182NG60_9DIPT